MAMDGRQRNQRLARATFSDDRRGSCVFPVPDLLLIDSRSAGLACGQMIPARLYEAQKTAG